MVYGVLFITTIVAFVISSISGGGASIVLIPILDIFLPTAFVPLTLTIGTFSSSVSRVIVFRKHINWRIFIWFVPFAIPFVILGALLLNYMNPLYLQFIISLFLLGNVPMLLRKKKAIRKDEKPHAKFVLIIVGALAGFVSGITGAVGLLFNRFYLKYGLSKEAIVATRVANEIVFHIIKLIIYIGVGLYSSESIIIGFIIAIGAYLSAYLAKWLLPYLSEHLFRKIGYGAMVFAGLFLAIKSTNEIIEKDNIYLQKSVFLNKNETKIFWRDSYLKMEYSWEEGIEIEIPIKSKDLPAEGIKFYNELASKYETIVIEEVYAFGNSKKYEFYCYNKDKMDKFYL